MRAPVSACGPASAIRSSAHDPAGDAHGAIILSAGFPDFDPPEELKRAAEQPGGTGASIRGDLGAPNFRAALARKQSR